MNILVQPTLHQKSKLDTQEEPRKTATNRIKGHERDTTLFLRIFTIQSYIIFNSDTSKQSPPGAGAKKLTSPDFMARPPLRKRQPDAKQGFSSDVFSK